MSNTEIIDTISQSSATKDKPATKSKKKYRVVLKTPTSVIYNDGNTNRFIKIKKGTKVGDFIEI